MTIQAATVGIVSGTGSQPVVTLGAGKTPLLTPVGGVDASNNLVPLLVNADGSLQVTGGTGGGGGGGDASAANQVIGNNYLNSIDGKTPALVGGRQPVDGSGVTQPVSGTFWQATQPVSASALPLPTGAATSANQATGNSSLSSIDGKITVMNSGATIVSSSALPTGASTSALQTTGNSSLSSIDSKIPALVNGAQPVQIASTNFIASVNNSTTAQLGAGATFTGVIESIFNQQSVSLLLTSDKAGTLTLNQYIDAAGTKLISSWVYSLSAGVPFSRAFTGNGNYFNLTYKNIDSSSTTTLQIDTAYGTLSATTNLGNGNISINEINGDSISNTIPSQSAQAVVTRAAPQKLFRTTFANAVSNGIDTSFWATPLIGTGMTVNQAAGNLVVTTGTTVNDETIIRSNQSFKGNMELKWSTTLSQRIVNQNFYIELVDLIGDGLAYTINSATSVTVTIPNNPFTSANVGQSLIMQQIAGTAGTISGRYAIASVAGNAVTFTVVGFPASGTGTMSLVGWNYVRATYNGATATAVVIETQRRGYNTSSSFTAAINTTAAPGHVGVIAVEDAQVSLLDQLQVAAATLNLTRRGESVQNLPEESTSLFLQIHVLNGTVAPASTTTWTLGLASLAQRSVQNVAVNSISSMSQNTQLPVNVVNTPAVTVSSGTVTAVTTLSNGQTAHSAAATGSPLRVSGKVTTALDTTLIANDASDVLMTTGQQLVTKDFATSENDWQFTGALTTTTAAAAKAAGAASIRNFVTGFSYQNTSAVATTVLVLDGATTIAQFNAPATMLTPAVITFPTPLRGTTATALNLNCGTTAANVLVNIQGYQSF